MASKPGSACATWRITLKRRFCCSRNADSESATTRETFQRTKPKMRARMAKAMTAGIIQSAFFDRAMIVRRQLKREAAPIVNDDLWNCDNTQVHYARAVPRPKFPHFGAIYAVCNEIGAKDPWPPGHACQAKHEPKAEQRCDTR